MKNNIVRISFLPIILIAGLTFADLQQHGNGKSKGNKEEHSQGRGNGNAGQGKGQHETDRSQGNGNNSQSEGNKGEKSLNKDNSHGNKNDHANRGNSNKGEPERIHDNKGKGNRETINWAINKNLDWGFENFPNRKRPNDHKKVTICHVTGNGFPVSITVSENALNAHLNHGDKIGNCTADYGVWTPRYIRTRENVYNVYEQTWERMSYSEALLTYAVQRLLGLRTDLDRLRPALTVTEVQRREALILDLQNNVTYLQTEVDNTRPVLASVNFNIML